MAIIHVPWFLSQLLLLKVGSLAAMVYIEDTTWWRRDMNNILFSSG